MAFLLVQTVRPREYFLTSNEEATQSQAPLTTGKTALLSTGLLLVSLVAVVVLTETLTPWLERVIAAASAPKAAVGIVIATLVLLPKALASLRAGSANRLPTSMNLALGSVLASIGLTIPTVAVVAIWLNKPRTLGLNPKEEVLLLLTLLVSTLTLGTGRTTVLQGLVHLVIFAVFLVFVVIPERLCFVSHASREHEPLSVAIIKGCSNQTQYSEVWLDPIREAHGDGQGSRLSGQTESRDAGLHFAALATAD